MYIIGRADKAREMEERDLEKSRAQLNVVALRKLTDPKVTLSQRQIEALQKNARTLASGLARK